MIRAVVGAPFLPRRIVSGRYDAALFFCCEPIMAGRVDAGRTAVWVHTDWGRFHPIRALVNRLFPRADLIVNVSDQAKESFDRLLDPCHRNRSVVIGNTLSKDWMMKRAAERDVPKKEGLRILSVGRLSEPKNFFRALDAAKSLSDRGLAFDWKIVGGGELEAALRKRLSELGLEGRVTLEGAVSNPYPYYRWADLFVCTSDWEGKSVSVCEAQAFALPTLITRYGTASSQLEDGVDGMIVDLSAEAVADGIARLAADEGLRRRLADTCASRDYTNRRELARVMAMAAGEEMR